MKSVGASGITEFIKSNTGCDTDYFIVIQEVIQGEVGSTAGITADCPEWGIYREGFREILHLPNQYVKRIAFYVSGKLSTHNFLK